MKFLNSIFYYCFSFFAFYFYLFSQSYLGIQSGITIFLLLILSFGAGISFFRTKCFTLKDIVLSIGIGLAMFVLIFYTGFLFGIFNFFKYIFLFISISSFFYYRKDIQFKIDLDDLKNIIMISFILLSISLFILGDFFHKVVIFLRIDIWILGLILYKVVLF